MQTFGLLYMCLAVVTLTTFANMVFVKWRERVLTTRLRAEIENAQIPVGDEILAIREQIAAIEPAPQRAPEASLRTDTLSTVRDMHRRGESVPHIATILGLRRADVKLSVLVNDLMFPPT